MKLMRIVMILSATVLFLLVIGVGYEAVSSKVNAEQYEPPGELIAVGENTLHVRVLGEQTERPPIIIEAGSGSFSYDWFPIQEKLAEETMVVTYDRAGYGWSGPNQTERTFDQINEELHALLETKGIHGPYILVGHSLGGLYMRNFAARYPDEVAGMVLVDPRPVGMNQVFHDISPEAAEQISNATVSQNHMGKVLATTGLLRLLKNQLMDGFTDEQKETYVNVAMKSKQFDAMNEEVVQAEKLEYGLANQDFDHLPLMILTHSEPMGFDQMGFSEEEAEKLEEIWLEKQQETATLSRNGKVMKVEGGHNLMLDNPEEVSKIILEVLLNTSEGK